MLDLDQLSLEASTFGIQSLQNETGLSRSHIYGIVSGRVDPKVSTYRKLLMALGYKLCIEKEVPSTGDSRDPNVFNDPEYLYWCLAHFGAPLICENRFSGPAPSVNQVLLEALKRGRIDANINSVLPVFLFINKRAIDWVRTKNETTEKHYLAYLLNLVIHITNDLALNEIFYQFQSELLPQKNQPLIKNGKLTSYKKSKFKNTDNMIAKTWRFQTADSLSDIRQRFNRWRAS